MVVSTTDHLEGRRILRYLGVVSGEAILGANLMQDHFIGIRDVHEGDSKKFAAELNLAKTIALDEMKERAASLGANAIVGVDIDYQGIHSESPGAMLLIAVNGTAVVTE
ncbi:MAG: heavy metal-binding domain-containing protein [Planctomycetota bacterium]|nr:heavy metal-binding domain-containing protein [Planctomycetota bacterium]